MWAWRCDPGTLLLTVSGDGELVFAGRVLTFHPLHSSMFIMKNILFSNLNETLPIGTLHFISQRSTNISNLIETLKTVLFIQPMSKCLTSKAEKHTCWLTSICQLWSKVLLYAIGGGSSLIFFSRECNYLTPAAGLWNAWRPKGFWSAVLMCACVQWSRGFSSASWASCNSTQF